MSLFYGNIVYQDDKFIATESQGRMYMFWADTVSNGEGERCGEIVNGRKGFEKTYKGDFQKWIQAIQKRELKTMNSYFDQAAELKQRAMLMAIRNGFDVEDKL